ncbi:PD-(D/E)XK nuclease family protein [Novipirellula artificiosorum]|uniref:Uncharacterized protein n=1 Tax=Novipirellula artificiosorum TaxID=2528016 RepID=A0A5C6DDL8_9BACT|nr:hypothetical protein [Novipirellula artificiosorum]TWU34890.1 hypothetical protein Poly41_40330 [Novipirellula artificiosorum]
MNSKVFEYQIDSRELEPYYSQYVRGRKSREPVSGEEVTTELAAETSPTIEEVPLTESDGPIEPETGLTAQTPPTEVEPETENNNDAKADTGRVREFVSVHDLGQFAFCRRAGVRAFEKDEREDEEDNGPRLTYLPNFDRDRIQAELSKQLRLLGMAMLYAAVAVAIMYVGIKQTDFLLFMAGFGILVLDLMWGGEVFWRLVILINRRHQADSPKPLKIDLLSTAPKYQRVNWWSALAAGYEPGTYQSPVRHPEWPLEGCPWRVLKHGSRRIPVIHSGAKNIAHGNGVLHDKHQCRVAAYCALLESMGNYDSPFGIVFPADSAKGIAMIVTPDLHEKVRKMLGDFLKTVELSENQLAEPKQPDDRSRCRGCSLGEPIEISKQEYKRETRNGVSVKVAQARNGKLYHCECGDRFGTIPPHAKSCRLGLVASVEEMSV